MAGYVPLRDSVLDNPKVMQLSDTLAWGWVRCLLLAQRHDSETGRLPSEASMAYTLHLTLAETSAMISGLVEAGLLDRDGSTLTIHDWQDWQSGRPASSAERMRALRGRKKQADAKPEPDQASCDAVCVTPVTRCASDDVTPAIQFNSMQGRSVAPAPAHARERADEPPPPPEAKPKQPDAKPIPVAWELICEAVAGAFGSVRSAIPLTLRAYYWQDAQCAELASYIPPEFWADTVRDLVKRAERSPTEIEKWRLPYFVKTVEGRYRDHIARKATAKSMVDADLEETLRLFPLNTTARPSRAVSAN